ncbi:MAG: pyridoxal-phosphate dependent enzyme, partial [Clostridia bacterium]|nr:pyridoxal-phosphate dependent enzyme [Clostridia bacterium]
MIYQNISELVGHTPLFFPAKLAKDLSLKAKVLCKLEYFNPAGSAKDRVALAMISAAESAGILKEDSIIVEPTSGNTGIGLAAIAASRGYRVVLTMPESMSIERRRLLSMYGAEIVLTSAELGMQGAIQKAEEIARECKNAWIPSQFDNPVNAEAHYKTTGPEIWSDTKGNVDIFVAGVGTGGTLTGAGRYLKEQNPNAKVVAVEPLSSPMLSQGHAGAHGLQGIGANFIPSV